MVKDCDGFEIEDCDCPHGKMIKDLGVTRIKQLACHYAGGLVSELARLDTREETESEHKEYLASLMTTLVVLFHSMAHYVGTERMDEMMEGKVDALYEEQEIHEQEVSSVHN